MSKFQEWERKNLKLQNMIRYRGSNADERAGSDLGPDHRDTEEGLAGNGLSPLSFRQTDPKRHFSNVRRIKRSRVAEQVITGSDPELIREFQANQSQRQQAVPAEASQPWWERVLDRIFSSGKRTRFSARVNEEPSTSFVDGEHAG